MSENDLPISARTLLDQEALRNAASAAGMQFKIFLAGPYIETTGKKPGSGEENKPKRLRFDLFNKLSSVGWTVTLGEYTKLIDATSPLLRKRNNAATAEYVHARDHADAIIMIPSSPGSFLELGAFSLNEKICRKMLIIIDVKYERSPPNYFNTGPIVSAKNHGSIIKYIDYDDVDICWTEASEFVEDQVSRAAERRTIFET